MTSNNLELNAAPKGIEVQIFNKKGGLNSLKCYHRLSSIMRFRMTRVNKSFLKIKTSI